MDEKVKLFFEIKKVYPELTVADVETFYSTKPSSTTNYEYSIEKGICSIFRVVNGKSEVVSRIKGTEEDAARKIAEIQKSDTLEDGKDGLLQYIYNKLKAVAISK